MEKIKLIKSTFLHEKETKEKVCDFIRNTDVLSMNLQCELFEKNFSLKQGRKFSVYVSNGSCANLLLIQALLNTGRLKKGEQIFVSSLTWPTNIMPLIQLGLIPVLLDVEENTLNVSSRILKESYQRFPNVKGLFLTNALGFCSDIEEIEKFCQEKDILLLEDNCESLGSEYNGRKLGNFSYASTFSFFVGHHLSTIEGGMICTDDEELYEKLKLARAHGWTRNNSTNFKNKNKKDNGVDDFYDIYSFYDLAFNFRPTEIQGFIGNLQLQHWDEIVRKRENNFKRFSAAISGNQDIVKLRLDGMTIISNFGFPLLFNDAKTYEKYREEFKKNNIEIRPIIGGNMRHQPFFKKIKDLPATECPNADSIHKKGFYFGNNPEMTDEEIERITKILEEKQEYVGITGSSGVLGSIIVNKLKKENIKYSCFPGDICSTEDIENWLKDNKFTSIIHLAAIVPTVEVEKNPKKAFDVNVNGTKNLAQGLEKAGHPWFFYASTSHVYKSKQGLVSEEDETEPVSEYGRTKFEAEKALADYKNLCIGRIFSFFHESQKKPFLYPSIKERLETENLDDTFELKGAESVRDFLNAEDLADTIINLMKKKILGTYNLASGKGIKIKDFVQGMTSVKLKIKSVGEPDFLAANITKLKNALQ
jgi:CDP-6-deoxy-D-xylo-4-hexulose-3-dehydrase